MTAIVKLDKASELTLIEESKAKQIQAVFEPMVQMLETFESAYSEIMKEAENGIDEELTGKAKRLRIDIGKVRIQAEKIRKEQKEEYLRAGKAIDGVNNLLKWAVQDRENELEEIEKHFERIETERLEKLQEERAEELSKYVEDAHERDLSSMEPDVWDAYLGAKKQAYDDRIEAERKAEAERLETERLEQLRSERELELAPFRNYAKDIPNDLEKLTDGEFQGLMENAKSCKKAEQDRIELRDKRLREMAPFVDFIEEEPEDVADLSPKAFDSMISKAKEAKLDHVAEQERIRIRSERLEVIGPIVAFIDEKIEKIESLQKKEFENLVSEAKAKAAKAKEKAEAERKRIAEMEKAEADRKAAEGKRIKAEKAAAEKARKAPVKKRLSEWVGSFQLPELPGDDHEKAGEIRNKFDAFKDWAEKQVENI